MDIATLQAAIFALKDRIDELEQENERLRKYELKVLDDQYAQGMEDAAVIVEQFNPYGSMGKRIAQAIRAKIKEMLDN